MKVYVYADESGAFDKIHNDWFVYGGVVLLGSSAKRDAERRYIAIERKIKRLSVSLDAADEAKASRMTLKERKRAFSSISRLGVYQFAAIVDQKRCHDNVFDSKRRKQRFLDYALKRGIKYGLENALRAEGYRTSDVDAVSVVVDEHSTSTDGKYNLAQSINEELRFGVFSPGWNTFHEPLFSADLPAIPVSYVDSAKVTMVRAADITANWAYMAVRDQLSYPAAYRYLSDRAFVLRLP
jgi:hypothetical protein